MSGITSILLLTFVVTGTLAVECYVSGAEVSDCTWSVGSTHTVSHDIIMSNVVMECNTNEDCIVVRPGVTLTINGGTAVGVHAARYIDLEEGANLDLSDQTISNFGSQDLDGGAIHGAGSNTVNLVNIEFGANVGNYGGCIWLKAATKVTISGCNFHGNAAAVDGGAMRLQDNCPDVTITDTKFDGNTAAVGGGLSAWDSVVKIESSSFHNNIAQYAGGIDAYGAGSVSLSSQCSFDGNVAGVGKALMCWALIQNGFVITIANQTAIPADDIANNDKRCLIIQS